MMDIERRDFLKSSAALAAMSAAGFSCVEFASAAPIAPPTVDRLQMRVLVDGAFNLFLRPGEVKGVKIEPPPRADYRRAIHNEWGLSLLLESQATGEARTVLLDFGYTPAALLNNLELVGADPKKIEALIVSHGHFDHFGGLIGFLDKFRASLPPDLTLYAGGEDNFCHRLTGPPGQLSEFGALDRRELASRNVKTVLAENPVVIASCLHHRQDQAQQHPSAFCPTRRCSSPSRTGSAATPATMRRPNCSARRCRTNICTSTRRASTSRTADWW